MEGGEVAGPGVEGPLDVALQAGIETEHGLPFVHMRVTAVSGATNDTYLAPDDAERLGVSLIRLAAGAIMQASVDAYCKVLTEHDRISEVEAVRRYYGWFSSDGQQPIVAEQE